MASNHNNNIAIGRYAIAIGQNNVIIGASAGVGIGTTSPSAVLHIKEEDTITTIASRIELLTGIMQYISSETGSFRIELLYNYGEPELALANAYREIGKIKIWQKEINCYGHGRYRPGQKNFEYSNPKFNPAEIIDFYKEISQQ